MLDNRYKTSASCVYSLNYHLVWCPKYRKKVLVGRVESRLRELLYEIANNMGVEIEALEITPALPGTSSQGRGVVQYGTFASLSPNYQRCGAARMMQVVSGMFERIL